MQISPKRPKPGTHHILLDGVPCKPIPSLLDGPVPLGRFSLTVMLGREDLDDSGLLKHPRGQARDEFRVQGPFTQSKQGVIRSIVQ